MAVIVGVLSSTATRAQDLTGFSGLRNVIGPHQAWSGVDASEDVWLFYSGVTLAPWSETLHRDGWRVRLAGGYGGYQYRGDAQPDPGCRLPQTQCSFVSPTLPAITSYVDALVGYQLKVGDLTTKVFVGLAAIDHDLPVPSQNIEVEGTEVGPKVVLELWLDIGRSAWTSLDLSITTAHETKAGRWRAGWRLFDSFAVGTEARFDGTADGEGYRAGVFANYNWDSWELSVAGGFGSTAVTANINDAEPYATINLLKDF